MALPFFPTKKHKWLLSMNRRLLKIPPPPGPVNTSATSAARRKARPENQLTAASTRSAADPAALTRSCAAYWPLDKMADIFFKPANCFFDLSNSLGDVPCCLLTYSFSKETEGLHTKILYVLYSSYMAQEANSCCSWQPGKKLLSMYCGNVCNFYIF